MTARPEDYGEPSAARTGLVFSFPFPPPVAPDASDIVLPRGWRIDRETGRGVPVATPCTHRAWMTALEGMRP